MTFFQNRMLTMAQWSVVGILVSISFSKALFNTSSALMIIGWLLSGDFPCKWQLMQKNPVTKASVALFFIIVGSALYSEADLHRTLIGVQAYSKLLFIPIIVSLIDTAQWRRRCWNGFAAGMVVTLAHVYADVWLEIPWTRTYQNTLNGDTGVFEHHIAQTVVMAFFTAFCLHRAWTLQRLGQRLFWVLLSLLSALSITHLSIARTGQVTLLMAMLTLLMVSVPKKWVLPSLGGFILMTILLVFSSSSLQNRFQLAYEEVTKFQFKNDYSSVGARLQMWNISLDLIKERPLLGHGVGSYPLLAEKAFADERMCNIGCAQPHNQYLLFGVEIGLLGVLVFASLLASICVAWLSMPDRNPLLPVYVTILGLTCLSDSGLLIRAQAYFFIPMLGLLASGPFISNEETT
ncbi:MAG: O-antigen ligase family protein [Hydrogenophaga sp.]|uniref:O-antigen ligase family protein n=1 Tax=Hydrogenophaga sp. TaxID=1904254 RepID=UPI00276F7C45|nr:O-antigen ligase family protein [Hydrogenophaga sp.]MDP2418495.1 O-antigen ligase family protein [Hydrogenophaga sp.]MDZ4187157.1 O-antigen ligase family protein [Hydrogenophaga sp.]